jgi:hypothetical protein
LTNNSIEWRRFFYEQMQKLYPGIYRGERSKMCCGSSSKKSIPARNQVNALGRNAPPLVGAAGMVAVEYLGQSNGAMGFTGPVTGTTYTFSVSNKIKYIDAQDLDGLLAMYHNQRQLFHKTVIEQVKPVVAQAVKVEQVKPVAEEIHETDIVAVAESIEPTGEPEKPKRKTRKKKDDAD